MFIIIPGICSYKKIFTNCVRKGTLVEGAQNNTNPTMQIEA